MGIKAAFEYFLGNDELVKKAKLSDVNRRALRHKLTNDDITLRQDTMRSWLLKAGFKENSFWTAPK